MCNWQLPLGRSPIAARQSSGMQALKYSCSQNARIPSTSAAKRIGNASNPLKIVVHLLRVHFTASRWLACAFIYSLQQHSLEHPTKTYSYCCSPSLIMAIIRH